VKNQKGTPMDGLIFMDLHGNPIPDPHDEICQINRPIVQAMNLAATLTDNYDTWTKEDYERFHAAYLDSRAKPVKKISYKADHLTAKMGATELWGRRSTQEDRIIACLLPEFSGVTQTDAKYVLVKTPEILQQIMTKHRLGLHQGSTLCSTVINGNTVFTTSVGDSTAFSCVINKEGKTKLKLLNRVIHHPAAGRLVKLKTGSSLAVSRAIGDVHFEEVGLTHDADFYLDKIEIPSGGKAFVINACDGLMDEYWRMSIKEIEMIIKKSHKKHPHITPLELSFLLAEEAYKRGSTDNISVMVTPIHPKESTPRLMVVLDGHGGDEVSETLSQLYVPVLQNQLLLIKFHHRYPGHAEEFRQLLHKGVKGQTIQEVKEVYEKMNHVLRGHGPA
jgi:serine/threonine protein phosphatase PrpC